MTALAADRNTATRGMGTRQKQFGVGGAEVIFKGALVATDASGFLKPADDAAGDIVQGIALQSADNTGGSDGDEVCLVEMGPVALLVSDGTPSAATVGSPVTVLDDQTVSIAATTTNDIVAGRLLELNGTDAWVAIRDQA